MKPAAADNFALHRFGQSAIHIRSDFVASQETQVRKNYLLGADILPDTDAAGAHKIAQELIAAVSSLSIPHAGSPVAAHVTISIGFACVIPSDPGSVGELLSEADKALDLTKGSGRNRVAGQAMDTQISVF